MAKERRREASHGLEFRFGESCRDIRTELSFDSRKNPRVCPHMYTLVLDTYPLTETCTRCVGCYRIVLSSRDGHTFGMQNSSYPAAGCLDEQDEQQVAVFEETSWTVEAVAVHYTLPV